MKKFTSSGVKSFLSGIFTTAILQSSNVMSVLVLAFVGTGILSLTSALAVILWASVWTMIPTSILWIIWLSFDVTVVALPLIFLWAVWVNFFSRIDKVVLFSKFLLSLWLIFLSFVFMKLGLNSLTENLSFSIFEWMSLWMLFLLWLMLTLLVQSWSMTFIIVLASVWTGFLDPNIAFPVIFWWYIWSTITIVLWALWKWSLAIKRQVAVWHVWFNLITALCGMLCLPRIVLFYESVLEPSVGVVIGFTLVWFCWRTIFALIFLPMVNSVSRLLQWKIKDRKQDIELAIQKIFNAEDLDPAVAQLAVKQDMLLLFWYAIKYNLNVRDFSPVHIASWTTTEEELLSTLSFKGNFDRNDLSKVYRDMKYIQNELLEFIVPLPVSEKSVENAELYQSILLIWDSCKTLKDVWSHIEDWQWSSSDDLQKDYEITREMVLKFYGVILHLYQSLDSKKALLDAQEMLELIQKENDEYLAQLRPHKNDDILLTSLIQTRRYLVQSCCDLLHAIELYKAWPDEIKYFKKNMANFMK